MMGSSGMLGFLSFGWFMFAILYVVVIIYVILLFKRLVEAVERIAARIDRGGPLT